MRVSIKKIGAINDATIDIKPMTVFVGPNNVGKTWVAYLLASIFSAYAWSRYTELYLDGKTNEKYDIIERAIKDIINKGNAKIDLEKFVLESGKKYINDVANCSAAWIKDYLPSKRLIFDDVNINIGFEEKNILDKIFNNVRSAKMSFGQKRKKSLLNLIKERHNYVVYFYTEVEDDIREDLPLQAIKGFVARNIFRMIQRAFFRNVYILPTERTTIVTFPYQQMSGDISEDESEIKSEEKYELRFSEVIRNFLGMLAVSMHRDFSLRQARARKIFKIKYYINLSKKLEKDILGGDISINRSENDKFIEVLFSTSKNLSLEIPIVSSMVKELSSLVFYLRYIAEPGELLIIDEPEMNLHPEAQVKLIELLAMMSNKGLNILLTTHSPYVVDHLINLIKAFEHSDKSKIKNKFFLKDENAFISKDLVSVYLFGKGTAKNILKRNGLIDWGTFSNISEKINKIYFEI